MPAIQRWGNSLAVRIPAAVASALAVVEGTPIEVAAGTATRRKRCET